jgi:glycosyltransferase involved in cell wall biosynthesis
VAYPAAGGSLDVWSGIPAGLLRGLSQAGVETVFLDASPGRGAERAARAALSPLYPPGGARHPGRSLLLAALGPEIAWLRARALDRRLPGAGRLDALVILGGLLTPNTDIPLVPWQDMTVPLAHRFGYPLWRALPGRALRARLAQQVELHRRAVFSCTATRFAADSVQHDLGVAREQIEVTGLGTNHRPAPAERDWSRPRFLFVGLEWERKRGAAVLEGFRRVRDVHPEARLDVVGGHPRLSEEGVVGHGRVGGASVSELFSRATCFVMPSTVEPAGMVYVEAAMGGAPSIGTSVGGAPELIGPGGRVVDPYDQEGLTRAMLDLCRAEVAESLGLQARRHAERFTWKATAERLLQALAASTRR